jgi:FixJ family two-component response regulator
VNEPGTVFVVDDDASVRVALQRLLWSEGFRVESFATAEAFLAASLPDTPGCLLIDLQMPGLNGLDLQAAVAARDSSLPVVFLTGHGDVPTSVSAMKAGAVDFLTKPFDEAELLHAVRQALRQHAALRDRERGSALARQQVARLTHREREVLELVVQGKLNKQVAHALGITEKTVKAHRARVMEKLQAGSLAELVQVSSRLGIP